MVVGLTEIRHRIIVVEKSTNFAHGLKIGQCGDMLLIDLAIIFNEDDQ